MPAYSLPGLAFGLELLFCTGIFVILASTSKTHTPAVFYFVVLLALALLTKYLAVYALLMLLPFIVSVNGFSPNRLLIIFCMLALICNIPIHRLLGFPLVLHYTRLWFFLLLLVLLIIWLQVRLHPKYALAGLCLFAAPTLVFYRYKTFDAVLLYPSSGILYNFTVEPHAIRLYSCLGHRDTLETLPLSVQRIDSLSPRADHSAIVYNGRCVYTAPGTLKKPVILNRRYLVCLSDANNGVGMYHLAVKDLER